MSSVNRSAFMYDARLRTASLESNSRSSVEDSPISTLVDDIPDMDILDDTAMAYDPTMPPPRYPASVFASTPIASTSSSSSISVSYSRPPPDWSRTATRRAGALYSTPLSDTDSGIMLTDPAPVRRRPSSVLSRASASSSQTKATIPRSILSRTDQCPAIRRQHTQHSVKFVDMPTIHYDAYEDEEYSDDPMDSADSDLNVCRRPRPGAHHTHHRHHHHHPSFVPEEPPKDEKTKPGLFKRLARLTSPKPKARPPPRSGTERRPSISGPYPLAPPPPLSGATSDTKNRRGAGRAASIRSVKSDSSMRSSGRLRTFLGSLVS
ncbi:hypothetical protein PUNSTDRAFT_139987 [Punctularia strigosozonata HHB-11173 SS5]|uniref:uncharacterized protein n=1 Tax=Punctularia strigosozonata (strain HHB-11173) TaxID=741275 RepID=UPI0004418130|nr:uncharacterized protein PUNSTDRAFT_139987 [Punctularia strigosozonata HHB-11173 SS5]EIN13446.1 hypothetical protein PUNSTDRAFT_139987 [Punctularia strigosozonata HHB-11173 SS5]